MKKYYRENYMFLSHLKTAFNNDNNIINANNNIADKT